MSSPPDRDTARRARQAESFGAAAEIYERVRPGYPDAAIDWLLPPGARVVLDLGAGTGKLTRQLAARGLEVLAVEPSGGMRETLRAVVPGVQALAGTAEAIPLGRAAVDAVLVAQAWHWVDVPRAVPEVARVLRPGGQLGLIWNSRDESVGWVAQLSALMEGGVEQMNSAEPQVGPPFGPLERRDFGWAQRLSPDALVDLVASRSYVITASPEARAARLAAVRRLADSHPDLAGRAEFTLPYVTRCTRTQLPVA
jgi:SAM-dependent methyltransferase